MCNDFERHLEWKAFAQALEAAKLNLAPGTDPAALFPAEDTRVNDLAPILRAAGNGVELATLSWGFAPGRPGGAPVFNFRSEGRSFAKSKRCLIPASAFFEFTGQRTPKSKWRFELPDSGVMAVAGLWRDGVAGKGGAFTMLTVNPGPDVAPFHDRQIAIVPQSDWGAWIYLERPEAELLRPLGAGSLLVSLARSGSDERERDRLAGASAS